MAARKNQFEAALRANAELRVQARWSASAGSRVMRRATFTMASGARATRLRRCSIRSLARSAAGPEAMTSASRAAVAL
jgi:hypothetical protein